jgi:hypothetical protein
MDRTVAGAHPWEQDNPRSELREKMAAYTRFLDRGGSPHSKKGKRRRRDIQIVVEQIREERKR